MAETEREKVFDAQLASLMDQIVDICRKNNIGMVASFSLGPSADGDGDLRVTAHVPHSDHTSPFGEVLLAIYHGKIPEHLFRPKPQEVN
jgi:hypothetical protein